MAAEPDRTQSTAQPDGPAAAEFPLRVASIDVGSNAIRFLAAEFVAPSQYSIIEQTRAPVRLGHQVFLSGRLSPAAMGAAVDVLAGFSSRMQALDVRRFRAVATSAVRDARNGEEFLRRVRTDAGIPLEPITGAEEARLVHVAVRHRIALGRRRWMLADLGGGSVEVSVVDERKTYWSDSHEMGSVRLLEELEGADEEPGRFQRRLEEYTARLSIPKRKHSGRLSGFIATGGNIEALAALAAAPVDEQGVATLSRDALRDTIRRLAHLSYRQRVEELELREDRADVILPAAVVYETLCAHAGFRAILVPQVGLKEGVVLDLADDHAGHWLHMRKQDHAVQSGALALGRRYRFDQAHARQVARLALGLFDQLAALHGYGEAERRLLLAAALLHDIGTFIAYRRHHKHSLYILLQSELPGLSTREMRMVANIARYHRKSEPSPHHDEFTALDEADRKCVVGLSAILRVADALDREHQQTVERVHVEADPREVTIRVRGRGELVLERWAVEKKGGLFSRTFDRRLKLRQDPDPGPDA